MTKIVAWNIQMGGGNRVDKLHAALVELNADICVLTEWNGSTASEALKGKLEHSGWQDCKLVVQDDGSRYRASGILIASKNPLKAVQSEIGGVPSGRVLVVEVTTPVLFTVTGVHVPNFNEPKGQGRRSKYAALDGILAALRSWPHLPGVLVGDFNTGEHPLDESEGGRTFNGRETQYMAHIAKLWPDAFRLKHSDLRAYSYHKKYEEIIRGFRIDHAFVHSALVGKVVDCRYERSDASDHRPLIVELDGI